MLLDCSEHYIPFSSQPCNYTCCLRTSTSEITVIFVSVKVQLLLVRHKSYNQPLETKLIVKNGKRLKAFAHMDSKKKTGRHDANIWTMLRKWIG